MKACFATNFCSHYIVFSDLTYLIVSHQHNNHYGSRIVGIKWTAPEEELFVGNGGLLKIAIFARHGVKIHLNRNR